MQAHFAPCADSESLALRRYVGMTWTSFAALARLSVPTVTVLKNLTNQFVIVGAPLCPSLQGFLWEAGGLVLLLSCAGSCCRLHHQVLQ